MIQHHSPEFFSLIGIPYEEMDCFALVGEFYRRLFDLKFVDLDYDPNKISHESIMQMIKDQANSDGFVKVEKPEFGDIIVARFHGLPVHVAVYLGKMQILHTMKGRNSCIEKLDFRWHKRIEGFYRWLKFKHIH